VNLIWATLGYAILSSVIPIFNIEVYLAAIATQVSPGEALPLALAAGFGQAIGKLVWYWSVVRSMELPWMQRRLASEKRQAQLATWQSRIAGRPFLAGGVTFFSGLVGIPPLLVMGVAAGVVRMNVWIFFFAIVLGRGLQSWLILAGLASLFHR
jgi:membrane protein YqaA with SNARE-associated domain